MARHYSAPQRAEQARATRARIVGAARDLLLGGSGYAGMTITGLAEAAGVSPQTVYNSVGGKAEVIKAAYDTMLAGDEDTVPMSQRPEFRRVTEATDVPSYAAAYAAWVRVISDRVGPLLGVLLAHGPGGDPVLENFVATIDGERRQGNTNSLRGLSGHGHLPPRRFDAAVDAVWTLTAPEVYDRLVRRSGWTSAAYERWLTTQLAATLSAFGSSGDARPAG
ncbi:TetR/AcrR family transcriptional regulator [Amycolatopsis jejuensis]|uniref:TetR/AcrR family transcriptional regulator n=1 Tax=Amycolatopsis jejuensis TaxID=330084 RepID=UPI0007C44980|nr:TetR/AcrR family transcriptional regulator [Amycolatopsis jejuensis]